MPVLHRPVEPAQRVRTVLDVSTEITEIQKSMDEQDSGGAGGLFQPLLRMPLIVGLGLAVFQQITGINRSSIMPRLSSSSPALKPQGPRSWLERGWPW